MQSQFAVSDIYSSYKMGPVVSLQIKTRFEPIKIFLSSFHAWVLRSSSCDSNLLRHKYTALFYPFSVGLLDCWPNLANLGEF